MAEATPADTREANLAPAGVRDRDVPGRTFLLIVALTPVLALGLGVLTGSLDPMFANPPSIVGLPLGVVLLAGAGLLTGLGVAGVRRSRTPAGRLLAVVALTLPALVLVTFGPALIVILISLG